jgi:hypothetical protein
VLFSSETVAQAIHDQFEPVWVSVRDVPIVTIDFGSGHKLTRTLNGNVATYALHPDGTVLDILPGIYKPEEYVQQLEQMNYLYRHTFGVNVTENTTNRLAEYHKTQAQLLVAGKEPGHFEFNHHAAISKRRVENPLKFVLAAASSGPPTTAQVAHAQAPPQATTPTVESKASNTLRGWKEMAEDTKLNEKIHRKSIHLHLADAGLVQPKDLTNWLYKEVLHADLNDPYLGLGAILNSNYPFADEDSSIPTK